MAHYLIAQVKVKDNGWIRDYAANVPDIVHRHGGRYLVRGADITIIEGEQCDADLVAVVEFPDMDALQAFVSDPDYAPFAKARQAGSDSQTIAVQAADR